jgi:hypothetical protein
VTIWAFIRIGTNSRIGPNPRPARDAFAIVGEWLAQSGVVPLQPGPLHGEILEKLVTDRGATGPLVASTDQNFRRFPDLQWAESTRQLALRRKTDRSPTGQYLYSPPNQDLPGLFPTP